MSGISTVMQQLYDYASKHQGQMPDRWYIAFDDYVELQAELTNIDNLYGPNRNFDRNKLHLAGVPIEIAFPPTDLYRRWAAMRTLVNSSLEWSTDADGCSGAYFGNQIDGGWWYDARADALKQITGYEFLCLRATFSTDCAA